MTINILESVSWKEFRSLELYGCSHAEFLEISAASGVQKYNDQRHAALRRGIEFNLSLSAWWSIWQKSGLWSQRGRRGDQYAMCRYRDAGAYEAGNVYIATQRQNIKDRCLAKPYLVPDGRPSKKEGTLRKKHRPRPVNTDCSQRAVRRVNHFQSFASWAQTPGEKT